MWPAVTEEALMRRLLSVVVVLSFVASARMAEALPVIQPAAQDFGSMPVGLTRALVETFFVSKAFTVAMSPDENPLKALARISGRDAGDFFVDPDCVSTKPSPCRVTVYFLPKSPGQKSATLEVTVNGQTGTAALSGTGVGGKYSGKIVFKHSVIGPYGSNVYSAEVLVLGERAYCGGTIVDVDQGQTQTYPLTGPGLIQIVWNGADTYTINFACPNPSQNQPQAEWREEISSYKQKGKNGETLKGSWSEPAPETDPLNKVSGVIQMSWELTAR